MKSFGGSIIHHIMHVQLPAHFSLAQLLQRIRKDWDPLTEESFQP
jgi:hypothetical protein